MALLYSDVLSYSIWLPTSNIVVFYIGARNLTALNHWNKIIKNRKEPLLFMCVAKENGAVAIMFVPFHARYKIYA